jgi:cell division protein FtsL
MEANLTILVIICITAIIVIVCKSYEKNKQIESLEYDIEFEKEESKKELKKIGVQFIKIEESYIKVVDDWKK